MPEPSNVLRPPPKLFLEDVRFVMQIALGILLDSTKGLVRLKRLLDPSLCTCERSSILTHVS